MIRSFIFTTLALFSAAAAAAAPLRLTAPGGRLTLEVETGASLRWSLTRDGLALIAPSRLSLTPAGQSPWGPKDRIKAERRRSIRAKSRPAVPTLRSVVRDEYEELALDFERPFTLEFRLYDDGFAYRWISRSSEPFTVAAEMVETSLPGDPFVWAAQLSARNDVDYFHSSFEESFRRLRTSAMRSSRPVYLPLLVESAAGPRLLITESDLRAYPGLYLGASSGALRGVFPAYPAREEIRGGEFKQKVVIAREPFLARIAGARSFPWRVVIVAERDADLLGSDMVWRLAEPGPTPEEAAWVTPGLSTEEWIIDRRLHGVPFRAGVNTKTYEHYVDFAARHKLRFVLLDADWSDHDDLFRIAPGLDLTAIAARAKARGVSLLLWTSALTISRDLEASLDRLKALGAAGFMVDFMDRDDQPMIEFQERVAAAAWRKGLLVSYHGAAKPTGLERLYPNVITREAVMGHEHDKWSERVTPSHNLTIPFVRMPAGPMDYEGGCMVNASTGTFRAVTDRPMCQGTRAHALAAYVLFASPLQHLGGNPGDYDREPEAMSLLSRVPTVWDETVPLAGAIGSHAAVARRRGEVWWISAMADWTPRELALPTAFLASGQWEAEVWRDGPNADRIGIDAVYERRTLKAGDVLKVPLASGGGWTARLVPDRGDGRP